jgi:hypothetical protein
MKTKTIPATVEISAYSCTMSKLFWSRVDESVSAGIHGQKVISVEF